MACRLISYKACQNCTQCDLWFTKNPKNLTESTWIHSQKRIWFVLWISTNLTERCFSAPKPYPIDPNKTTAKDHSHALGDGTIPLEKQLAAGWIAGKYHASWVMRRRFSLQKLSGYSMILKLPFSIKRQNLYRCWKWVCLKNRTMVAFRSQRVIWKTEAVPSFRSKLLALLGWYLWYPLQLCRYPMMSLLKLSPSNGMVESISANTHLDLSEFDS